MPRREIFDETCDTHQTGRYDLLVCLAADSLRFALHDRVRRQFVALVDFPYSITDDTAWLAAFRASVEAFPWLGGAFASVRLGWRSPQFTALPQPFFQPERAKAILDAVSPVDDLDIIYFNRLVEDALLLFGVPSEMLNAFRTIQSNFSVAHSDTGLVRLACATFRRGLGVLLHADGDFATLILTKDGVLHTVLPFVPHTPTDALYRVAAVAQAQSFPWEESHFRIVGRGVSLPDENDPRKRRLLTVEALAEGLAEGLPHYGSRLAVGTYGFSYLLDKRREEDLALFSLMLCE